MLKISSSIIISAAGCIINASQVVANTYFRDDPDLRSEVQHIAQYDELTDELDDPDWQELEFGYIDAANIQRNADFVVFDAFTKFDLSYVRIEGNCYRNQMRRLRVGYFTSQNSVAYRELYRLPKYREFSSPTNSVQQELLDAACTASIEEITTSSGSDSTNLMPLQTGIYAWSDQGPFVSIILQGDRICYLIQSYKFGVSRDIILSVTELADYPYTYKLNTFDTFVRQPDRNTLLIGNREGVSTYLRLDDFKPEELYDLEPFVTECLGTTEPYSYEREIGY